jgi:hypothetical protein
MLSKGEALAISSWSEVELLSALGVKLRTRQLTADQAHDVNDSYDRLISAHLFHIDIEILTIAIR